LHAPLAGESKDNLQSSQKNSKSTRFKQLISSRSFRCDHNRKWILTTVVGCFIHSSIRVVQFFIWFPIHSDLNECRYKKSRFSHFRFRFDHAIVKHTQAPPLTDDS
jgi:hypothetical protein